MGKKFLIADRTGNVMYSDHSDGMMMALLFTNCQKFAKMNFHDRYSAARTQKGGQLVFQQFSRMNFVVYSDEGETEVYLKSQLLLLYELLILVWGSSTLAQKNFALTSSFSKHKHILPPLISTSARLCDTQQSFLVKALEMLEVNSDIRAAFLLELKTALRDIASASHAIIFVGTKILAVYTKPKTFDLSTTDLFLLSIYVQAQFHPVATAFPPQSRLPVEDTGDHESASEDSVSEHQEEPIFGSNVFNPDEKDLDHSDRGPLPRLRDMAPPVDDASLFNLANFKPRDTYELLHLRAKACWAYCSEFASQISLVVISNKGTGSQAEKDQYSRVRDQLRSSLKDSFSFLIIKFPGLVHFIFVDRTKNRLYAPAVTPLHGQESALSEADSARMRDLLQSKIWAMVYQAQEYLSLGFNLMHLKGEDFQYSYRVWLEDDSGQEQPLDKPLAPLGPPLSIAFYDSLSRVLYPSQKGLKCFEMFTLFIGSVPFDTVAASNAALAYAIKRNNL